MKVEWSARDVRSPGKLVVHELFLCIKDLTRVAAVAGDKTAIPFSRHDRKLCGGGGSVTEEESGVWLESITGWVVLKYPQNLLALRTGNAERQKPVHHHVSISMVSSV